MRAKRTCVCGTEFVPSGASNQKFCSTKCRPKRSDSPLRKRKGIIAVSKRRRLVKALAVQYLGGKCVTCGYDRCNEAFDFHHRDPSQKEFGIGSGDTRSFEKIKIELNKCDLLCANCHRELHSRLDAEAFDKATSDLQ